MITALPLDLLALETLDLCEALVSDAAPDPLEDLLREVMRTGARILYRLASRAVERLLTQAHHLKRPRAIFSDKELEALAGAIHNSLASADLLARSLFLEQERLALGKHGHRIPESRLYEALVTTPVPPLEPNRAVAFFRALLPTLGVDPLHFGKDLARHAFTLAVATDEHLLKVVQDFLADQLQTGQISTGPKRLKAILDLAGVTPRNPQYAEMVFRTNTMDAYAQAAQEELSARADKFPVWRYSNPDDSRSRPTHSEKNGRYYPSTVPFRQVRGIEPQDVCNCRCVAIPIYWRDWVRLRAGGAAMAPGYSDPWPTDTPAKFALRIAD